MNAFDGEGHDYLMYNEKYLLVLYESGYRARQCSQTWHGLSFHRGEGEKIP